jgi:uncharacterized membrane protein YidH (DUF202 family)
VRFTRHLIAVLLIVAAVTALAVAWAHSREASWLAGPGPVARRHPPAQIQLARRHADNGPGLSLSDSGDLIRTALIESAIATAVIALSALRRHRRRMTRRTSLPARAKSVRC